MFQVENVSSHAVIISVLDKNSLVLDCGANKALFSIWMDDHIGCQVFGFEPDPRLFGRLPRLKNTQWIEQAIAGNSGMLQLGLGTERCSSAFYKEGEIQEVVEVSCTTLDAFCKVHNINKIDVLKLDIEGGELDVLELMSDQMINRIVQMTVEFHDFLNPNDLPRIKAIIKKFQAKGFFVCNFSYRAWGDVLFINKRHLNISVVNACRILLTKYLNGINRVSRRFLQTKRNHAKS